MIHNVRHTGIVVRDLEKMAQFYHFMGFVEDNRDIEKGPFIEQVTGIENVCLEWIKMRSPDGYLLELLQYHSHPVTSDVSLAKPNQPGCAHLAFTVKDIHQSCADIEQAGGSVINQPAMAPNKKVKVAYCHDPEGGVMWMVEELVI